MAKIYFTSDLHLGHKQIARRRDFDSVDDMDRTLIRNINTAVTAHDELWILGDFSYRASKDEAKHWLRQIHCQHVHLIRGNHDKDWTTADGWESIDDYVELKTEYGRIPLFHYPIESWNRRYNQGSYHFCGHVHCDEEENVENAFNHIRRYNVCVDANELMPISLDEIITRISDAESATENGLPLDYFCSTEGNLMFPRRWDTTDYPNGRYK